MVNQIIPRIRAKNGGRVINHSHNWMAGGIITAYAKMSGCPVLHTLHNVHTGHIPLEYLFGVDTAKLSNCLYRSVDQGKQAIDSQATAIKNANLVNFVGARFLREIVDGHFTNQPIISSSVRASGGKITYQRFDEPLSMLGFAAARGCEGDVSLARRLGDVGYF
jgi:hypothetical protein